MITDFYSVCSVSSVGKFESMKFIMFIYLKTTSMKVNWKQVALYVIKVIELILTGAAGGAVSQLL